MLNGRVLIKRVRAGTECAIGKEQCGFGEGRGCMDQVFAVQQVCQKVSREWGRIWVFMDLEKAFNMIDWQGKCISDAKSVCSLRKIVERGAEFLC